MGKGEIACYEQFLLFPVFSKGLFTRGIKKCHCVVMGLNIDTFPRQALISHVWSTSLLNTLSEKEKLLKISNFSFFQCFPPVWRTLPFSSNSKLLSANSEFGRVESLLFGKGISNALTKGGSNYYTSSRCIIHSMTPPNAGSGEVLALSIEITHICWLFNSNDDYLIPMLIILFP